MDIQHNSSTDSSANEATIDVRRHDLVVASRGGSAPAAVACRVALGEGTAGELSRETQSLLRRRLRLAAIVLGIGFAMFLVKQLVAIGRGASADVFLMSFQTLTTVVLGVIGGGLCHRHSFSLRALRAGELIVFGLPAAFFLALDYYMAQAAAARGMYHHPEGAWLLLIFTYALFIPNTLRRASVVVAVLAATPVVFLLWMLWSIPGLDAAVTGDQVTNFILMIALAAGGSVFGVDTIGSLRREAFEARQLGQYRLTRRIGAGGMGEVFLAEHRLLKRPCVVKLIRPDKAGNPNVLARFQREVRATAKLTHWNTIEIFDYGSTEDGTFYYVMEYLPGMSLAELVERFGPLPPERVIYLLRQACDALAEAHAAGLIHRDIKPGNVFAAERGGVHDVVKLLDFGLVKPLVDEESIHLTAEGSITGSPLFMSPEQAVGDSTPDARSDIYSLGAVGYYLLTGRPPFESDKALKVMFAHVHESPVPPSQLRPGVPADLERVLLRCLAKTADQRYPSATALEEAMTACAAAGGWTRADAARWWQTNDMAHSDVPDVAAQP